MTLSKETKRYMDYKMNIWKTLLLGMLVTGSAVSAPVELDKVAVIVNDGVILQSDIDTATKTLRANAKKADKPYPMLTC